MTVRGRQLPIDPRHVQHARGRPTRDIQRCGQTPKLVGQRTGERRGWKGGVGRRRSLSVGVEQVIVSPECGEAVDVKRAHSHCARNRCVVI